MHTTPSRTPTKSASMLSALTSRAASFFNDTEHLPAPPPRPAVPRSFSDHLITRRRPVMAPSPLARSSSFSALEAMQSGSTESQSSYSDDSSSSTSSEYNSSPPTSPPPSHPKQQQTAAYSTLALKRCDSTVHTVNAAHDVVVQTSPHSADFGQSAIVGVWEEPSQSPVQYRWTVTDYCQVDDGQWRRDESQGQRGQSQPRLQWEASDGRDASPILPGENEDRGRTLSAVEETKERGRTLARRSASPGARLMAKFAKKWRRVDGSV